VTQVQQAPITRPSTRQATEETLLLDDGTRLFYRAWLPVVPSDKALLLVHRGHEHSGRWQETVAALGLEDVAVFAWDARGHGRSPGDRGSAENLARVVKDLDLFVGHILEHHSIARENMIVLAHSVGAVTATAWVHDYAPPIRGLILATPAFRVKLYVPFAIPFLRLRQKLLGPGYVKSYVKPRMLTHDREQAERYAADPLIFRQIAVNILLDLHDTSTRLLADAGAITVPTLMLVAGSDWVVRRSAQEEFFENLSSPVKRMEVLPGFYHAIFHEKDRAVVVDKVRSFIEDCFTRPAQSASLLDADQRGYTQREYDRLCEPGKARYLFLQWVMKTGGRLSRGIRLGWQAGFDSGQTLDYVYENQARGFSPLGRLIDRAYLDSPGWRGIRQRKQHLEKTIATAARDLHAAGRPVRLVDIAAGPGRYILETIRALAPIPVTAILRDYKPENIQAARRLAEQRGLTSVTITQGDAFDRADLAGIRPRPTLAVVSGLYELFPENEPVLRSLQGLADALEPGGYLVYTNQPWHPQLEFIARVLSNREGKPWIMRRRTQAEMDELVRAVGFEKLSQEIDPCGIFTVSLARRAGS
jgi:alpha-beta hydrolase superfamily lysophospholipase/SAM-dependent methyltransferase